MVELSEDDSHEFDDGASDLPEWIHVERQRGAFCAIHALNNVFQGRVPPAVTDDELYAGAVKAAVADRRSTTRREKQTVLRSPCWVHPVVLRRVPSAGS